MQEIGLESDEALLLRLEDVVWEKPSSGGFLGSLGANCETGTLYLTNKHVKFIWKSGLISKTIETKVISLGEIKLYGGTAQVRASKPKVKADGYPITFYLRNGQEVFRFPVKSKREIGNWIESINELITGERRGFDPSSVGGINVGRSISEVVNSAKPVASSLADVAEPLVPVATAVAAARFPGAAEAVRAVSDTLGLGKGGPGCRAAVDSETFGDGEVAASPSEPVEKSMTMDEQVEAVLGLKKLLDSEVITEDEFQLKKKQILGL